MPVPSFSHAQIELFANSFENELTNPKLTEIFNACHISDIAESSKRRRMVASLTAKQHSDRCGNNVVVFVEAVMNPVRFIDDHDRFERLRYQLNAGLSFGGLQIGQDGKFAAVAPASSLSEAQERAGRLQNILSNRQVHPDVLRFCRAELVQDNYFHAVFEATKSVADKIRDKSGLNCDGNDLVIKALNINNGLLAINTLRTETEQSEQKGFSSLLQGIFGTFRNVTAHAPRIKWTIGEQDALDLLTMCSYVHRKLDAAVRVR